VETVTVVASRTGTMGVSEMEFLTGLAIVVAALAGMLLMRVRRARQAPHA
jgi:hypothetical protein